MYYPKSQITTNLKTNGDEFQNPSTNLPYVGYYYITSNGDVFSNKSPNDKPTFRLTPLSTSTIEENPYLLEAQNTDAFFLEGNRDSYYEIEKGGIYSVTPDNPDAPSPPIQVSPQPTPQDYELGEFTRYFGYKGSSYKTIETTKFQFNLLQNKSSIIQYDLFTPVSITWMLGGNKESTAKTNFNLVKLKEKNQNLPFFSKYFEGRYNQYFKFSKNENLYSNGKELIYSNSRKPYIGFYHIHPEKGPMVGAQHTKKDHDYLEFLPTGSTLNPLPASPQSGSYVEPKKEVNISIGGSGGY